MKYDDLKQMIRAMIQLRTSRDVKFEVCDDSKQRTVGFRALTPDGEPLDVYNCSLSTVAGQAKSIPAPFKDYNCRMWMSGETRKVLAAQFSRPM